MGELFLLQVRIYGPSARWKTPKGQLKLRGDDLVLSITNTGTSEQKQTAGTEFRIPISQIKDFEYRKGLLSHSLELKSLSLDAFSSIPGSDGISLLLKLRNRERSEANRFVKALRLRHTEIMVRAQNEGPPDD